MRSTTVGWLTSMVSVLPVTADHAWLNSARPELRDRISSPTALTLTIPIRSPTRTANTIAGDDRGDFVEGRMASGLRDMLQGYHWASEPVLEDELDGAAKQVGELVRIK